jgi:hypothetical protein
MSDLRDLSGLSDLKDLKDLRDLRVLGVGVSKASLIQVGWPLPWGRGRPARKRFIGAKRPGETPNLFALQIWAGLKPAPAMAHTLMKKTFLPFERRHPFDRLRAGSAAFRRCGRVARAPQRDRRVIAPGEGCV